MERIISFLKIKASIRWSFALALVAIGLLSGAAPVSAQATRTWVSGVGDDANPCSRTAPCKTFAGAISKTAARGEINCLDPGGFGAVTITKAITIDCSETLGGVLASVTNGINVNAGINDVITLRGLDINGAGTGLIGINYLAAGAVIVEECEIYGFNSGPGRGIFAPGGASPGVVHQLFVVDSYIRNNGIGIAGGGGIVLGQPAAAPNPGPVRAALDNVRLERNNIGMRANPAVESTVRNSFAVGNISFNFLAASGGGAAIINIDGSSASESVGGTGIRAEGVNAVVRISNTTVFGNNIGLELINGGVINSFGNNMIAGNFGGTTPPSPIPLS